MAVGGRDMSTWEPGAVSMVLLQQLGHLTNSVGGLLPQKLLDEDAPLLTSCEELSAHLAPLWSQVWPVLFKHMQLMVECGRTKSDLAATLTPAVAHSDNPTHREKACQQLLSVLEGQAKSFPPSIGIIVRGESQSLSEDMTSQLSLEEGAENGLQYRHGECWWDHLCLSYQSPGAHLGTKEESLLTKFELGISGPLAKVNDQSGREFS